MATIPIDAKQVVLWDENKLADEYALAVSGQDEHAVTNVLILEKELARRRISGDKPLCRLVGTDSNVFSIIGNVSRTLKRAGLDAQSKEFSRRAMRSHSYDAVLQLCMEYVEVE